MNDTLNQTIKDLHAAYLRESGEVVDLTLGRRFCWEAWLHRGFTQSDLELTLRFIKRQKGAFPPSTRFSRLIQDTEYFEEWFSKARVDTRRPPPPTPKQQVSEQAGFYDPPDSAPAKPIRDVMKESAALADLRQWKLKTFGTEL